MCRSFERTQTKDEYMAKNYFDRYVWLIDTITRHGHITKKEIDELWNRSSLNERRENGIPERTFHNHREAIYDTFGIEIKCDRALGYYIANSDALEGNGIKQWLLESLSMSNMLQESKDMVGRILFEKIPSSQKWLPVIVNAMKDEKALEITYQSFTHDEPYTFIAHPYCLKLFKQRWYMLGRSEEYDQPRIYALDERMVGVKQLEKNAVVPSDFDGQAFFSNYFGVIVGKDIEPTTVKIKVVKKQVKYIESLRLHHSQQLIEETPEYNVYSFYLVPTYDFRQEIFSHGSRYEVLCPEWFREEIKEELAMMYKNYGL